VGSGKRENRPAAGPGTVALALAALLGALNAAWAGFQWRELGVARRGGEAFCALGAGDACARLGDSDFAFGVEVLSGLPVAGWGVVWGLVAMVLPLLVLGRRRAGASPEPLWSAATLTAVTGLASVALLLAVSLRAGTLCGNCVLTYLGVGAYAGLVLGVARSAPPRSLASGIAWGAITGAVAFVALMPIASRTPPPVDPALAVLLEPEPAEASRPADPAGDLMRRVASLSPQARQLLSDARALYLEPPTAVEIRPPRALLGSPMAPVRITTFSDPLCSHCAELHEELEQLLDVAPPNTIALESRLFPLHQSCNPYLGVGGGPELRCLAARVLICLGERPDSFEIEGRILASQRELTRERLFELTAPYVPRAVLEQCVASPETQAKLDSDIEWAVAHEIEGTPMVLVNGRKSLAYLPFLYVMAATGGDTDHAVFRDLPPPSPTADPGAGAPPAASH
jgi:hypothetical protein